MSGRLRGAIQLALEQRPPVARGLKQSMFDELVVALMRGPEQWKLAAPLLGQSVTQPLVP